MITQLLSLPVFRAFTSAGLPLAGGQLFSYAAGTTTPQNTYSDTAGSTPNTNPVILDSTGTAIVRCDPTLVYKFQLEDANGNVQWTVDNFYPDMNSSNALSILSTLGFGNYPQTAAEITAGVTPINLTLPAGYVDRYAVNTTPGTTDMTTAFQAAVSQALVSGGTVYYGLTSIYRLTAAINCSFAGGGGCPGVSIRNLAPSHNTNQGIKIDHSSAGLIAFDCTGNDTIEFIDLAMFTPLSPGNIPKVGVLFARNSTGASLVNRMIRPNIVGYFSVANVYNYGSENFVIEMPYLTSYGAAGAGNCCIAYTSNNYASITSSFQTIATGARSMTVCDNISSNYTMNSPNSTSDCVHIEGVTEWRHWGGWGYNPGGRSMFYVDNSFSAGTYPCNRVSLRDFRTEHVGSFTLSGVAITGIAGQFSCSAAASTLIVGMSVTISGTYGGTGSITGYVNPTKYVISATNGSTTFTLTTSGGAALTTTAGTPTGLTYTVSQQPAYGIMFGLSGNPQVHTSWVLSGMRFDTAQYAIYCANNNSTWDGWDVNLISEQQSNGIYNGGTVQGFSNLRLGATTVNIGTLVNSTLQGVVASWTLGSSANCTLIAVNARPTSTSNTHTVAAGSVTNAFVNTTFDGGTGSTAYTIGDIVLALKQLGMITP